MSRLATLRAARSLGDLARILGFRPQVVSYVLYKQPPPSKYTTFQIPKRNGGHRTITAPITGLKLLQRSLSDLLQDCVDEIHVAENRTPRISHGFVRDRSILTNARRHRNRRWVFNIDLQDFFPSINFGRVRGFLLRNRHFQLDPRVGTVIAQIACHNNALPQGSPCSPVISNLIAQILDMRLVQLASANGCTYTRYADDLTFSTNEKRFPSSIAVPATAIGKQLHLWLPGMPLQKLIQRAGFRINEKKTRLMYRSSRQDVTGLVVNQKVSIRREYRHNTRAMVHRLVRTGAFDVLGVIRKDNREILQNRPGTLNELRGRLGFISSIESLHRESSSDSKQKLYRQFLVYSTFYAAETPVVICEGPTDNIYLTHAIRSLAVGFPDLAEVQSSGRIRLRVRLYKYPRSSSARILGLNDGGSSVLAEFMTRYRKEIQVFTAPGLKNPVIVLYDNDDGAQKIKNVIKKSFKVSVSGTEDFVQVFKNMYAVPTPGVPSTIEDYFDQETKSTIIAGKRFHPGGAGFDRAQHYGKVVFAQKVVARYANRINFEGFRPLLTNLAATISSHRSAIVPYDDQ